MDDLVLELECERVYAECRARGFSQDLSRRVVASHRGNPSFWRKFGDPGYRTMQLWAYVWHLAERVGKLSMEDAVLLRRGIGRLDGD